MKSVLRSGLAVLSLIAAGQAPAAPTIQTSNLVDLSLEQLTQLTVTSASRRAEPLAEAPASIFVITGDDIRRSGATSLPEALRLAPNLLVVRGDTSNYVASARGGITTTANKMLVLIDGRTVYTPLFSGVFYDAITLDLEDVDRIEVISGPGSTLWGTNAVNGVINVIMKSAARTRGGLAAVAAGDQERGANLRYGWSAGEGAAMRVFGRYFDRDDHALQSGAPAQDAAKRGVLGFRGDWERGRDATMIQASAYKADVDNLGGARDMSGGHVLARWRRELSPGSSLTVQAYLDRTEREHAGTFQETRDTLDMEMQHTFAPRAGHHLAWGAGHRASRDETVPTAAIGFMPNERTLSLTSIYAQDEIEIGERTRLTLGLRAERNSYTGVEWLPNLRLSHSVGAQQYLWAALTRTVRSPSRIDADIVVPGFPPFVVRNNPDFVSEIANVAEIGYRGNIAPTMSLSVTAFLHRFTKLRTLEPAGAQLVFANGGEGRVRGVEAWGDYRPSSTWRLVWGLTWMQQESTLEPGRVNLTDNALGNNPRRTASLRSQWNLTRSVELDLHARYVSDLPNPATPDYTELGARLGWRASKDLELSLVVNNAADHEHAEFGPPAARAVFGRSWLAKAVWTF